MNARHCAGFLKVLKFIFKPTHLSTKPHELWHLGYSVRRVGKSKRLYWVHVTKRYVSTLLFRVIGNE